MTTRGLIASAGVAAVEAVLALRHVAGRDFAIDLVAPTHALEHWLTSVAAAFDLGTPPPLGSADLCSRYAVDLLGGELARVDVGGRVAHLADGGEPSYELLLVAVGARLVRVLPGARRHLAIALPAGAAWCDELDHDDRVVQKAAG
jgi:hypothetical protein